MKETRIYRCDDTPEAIFTAVYDAGKSAYGHDHIRLEVNMPEAEQNYTLFSEYVDVVPDSDKMTKGFVPSGVRSRSRHMNILWWQREAASRIRQT